MLKAFTTAALLVASAALTACGGGEDIDAETAQNATMSRHASVSDITAATVERRDSL